MSSIAVVARGVVDRPDRLPGTPGAGGTVVAGHAAGERAVAG
ncbi:hypothetical protein [Streptomyces sp. NRRL B-24484]|nr:hypothetical protein [Streptomyces sp. NRRL B-24484]